MDFYNLFFVVANNRMLATMGVNGRQRF